MQLTILEPDRHGRLFEVWAQQDGDTRPPEKSPDSLLLGVGDTRATAMADAVDELHQASATLQLEAVEGA